MGSKLRLSILCLAVIFCSYVNGRAIREAADESEDVDNVLSPSNVEKSGWEAEEWLKVSLAPPQHVDHKLGSPLDLECEIVGTPPPEVKWIRGQYNANSAELRSNVVTEGSSGSVARVRARLFLDHIPSVGEHHFTCIGQVGGQIVHSTTHVKTSSSELFPSSAINIRHRSVPPSVEMLNHLSGSPSSAPVVPRITKWYNVLLETIGNSVVLPCEAFAQPHPQVYWLDNNDNMISHRDPRFKVRYDGSLLIVNLKWDDMGEFHCVAKNNVGKDTKGTFIYPMARE